MDLVAAINLASIACNDLFSNLRAEGSMSIRCPTTAKFTLDRQRQDAKAAQDIETGMMSQKNEFHNLDNPDDGLFRELVRLNTSAIAPTRMRLTAQAVSRLNQLRDTNLRPR